MSTRDDSDRPTRAEVLDLAERYACPNRVRTLRALGVDLVVGAREGYRLWDLDGREFLDLHLNGGVFNLGHRNHELVATLVDALQTLDIGNHHFPSVERALLARDLVELTPGMRYAVFASGGGEAVEVALKSARRATGRRRIVSVSGAYHGHTGLALAAGDERAAASFLSEGAPGEFAHVGFDDLAAIERELASGDVAAVVLETVPATIGFPLPSPGYLAGVRDLCDAAGALYVADEVQTGLGRTGELWGVQREGVVPDVLVCGKGLSGGLYPIAAALLSERAGAWLEEDGWAHISTFGGAEVGCRVAREVLAITDHPATRGHVRGLVDRFADGLAGIRDRYPDRLVEVRQTGLVIGLRLSHPQGGMLLTKALYDRGVWAMFAGFDPSVLQVKPGLLLDAATAELALERLDDAVSSLPAGTAA
ncbi:class-III pyridoxal-phosphate-dependent aminotransferase [Longivirga aurantiaca]|uniref:Aspartate aminotransferase family protein n=1 Tax=Longivirga aurantiaca TaxID=1837743 RepID=A0ABW1T1H1_9ACTN